MFIESSHRKQDNLTGRELFFFSFQKLIRVKTEKENLRTEKKGQHGRVDKGVC